MSTTTTAGREVARLARTRTALTESGAGGVLRRRAEAAVRARPEHRWLIISAPDVAVTAEDTVHLPAVIGQLRLGGRACQLVDLNHHHHRPAVGMTGVRGPSAGSGGS
jgi:hypothetical protein